MTRLIALLVLALLVVVGAAAVDSSYAAAGERYSQNESFSPDAGNVTSLDHSNLNGVVYDERVSVTDENGTEMIAGQDYDWLDSNGTVKTLAGGRLDGDASATIAYGYNAPTEQQTELATLMAGLFDAQRVLLFVLVAALVLASMRVLGGV